MALTVDAIVNNLMSTYDMTQTKALEVLNQRQARMVAESRYKARENPLTTTVANQNSYTLPSDVIDFAYVETRPSGSTKGGTRFDLVSLGDIRDIEAGRDEFCSPDGTSGLVAIYHPSGGGDGIYLYPAPSTTGQDIVAVQTFTPADSTYGSGDATAVPVQFREHLQDGCFSEGEKQVTKRLDLAAAFEQSFQTGVTDLKRFHNSRLRPSGPYRITVRR